ncbi:hypothetical protein [Rhodospirillum rubrum]|uniref:hypothetical protein n=1 Tax=Rhodospirillum rubrum TaxID=1085 RepID=UPI00003C2F30|nr:hypothetical protein [Rhodospirillum rubrum]AEO46856.1 hypothetical protein F11_01930 [Rhodospirillum rubrum F11]MBK5952730.1 hypothetical protein [Rhodospirillum rubrum]QXG80873.1 hypothetical protein KUL73_01990 [Rhodospirillum rubrum]HAQ00442.1 hypothetical protein [Rhodospirillum rubrum]HCF18063.1 hypothetical protein [Rhodospirillum rubrum]
MKRDAINEKVLKLLARFGSIDMRALVEEVSRVDAGAILQSGVLVDTQGKVQLGQVGVMEALLVMALGGKPSITMPRSIEPVRDALILFLKLNNTDRFGYRTDDRPERWAFRILDQLFSDFAQRKTLSVKDRLVLLHVSENPLWHAAFAYALQLYLQVMSRGNAFIQATDKPAMIATATAFRTAVEVRRAKIPKLKYGNPLAGFKEITEYAIGQYFDGQDLNDAMNQTLVQTQLGTGGEGGQERFKAFLDQNRITMEMFPTTASQLYSQVGSSIQFKHTEEEVSNVLYLFAKQINQQKQIEAMFANFAEAAFPVAAKCSKLMSFQGLQVNDAANLLARWMRESGALDDIRSADPRTRVEAVLETIGKDELTNLMAFRGGRTTTGDLTPAAVSQYVQGHVRMLTLNAVNQKMQRVQTALSSQMEAAEAFVARPGSAILKDMTFGVDEFFRTLRSVFRDIFEAADSNRQMQTRSLDEFKRKYGPLSTISVLVPRDPQMATGAWITHARKEIGQVSNYVFEKRMQRS